MQLSVRHDTLTFDRVFRCSLEVLWKAFESADARARWGLPSPTAIIIYDHEDFRVGGRDLARCGSRDDPRYTVDVLYLDIRPQLRIVYSERVSEGAMLLSCALHTVEVAEHAKGAELKITVQIAAVDSAEMAQGVRHGMVAALDNLATELNEVPATAR